MCMNNMCYSIPVAVQGSSPQSVLELQLSDALVQKSPFPARQFRYFAPIGVSPLADRTSLFVLHMAYYGPHVWMTGQSPIPLVVESCNNDMQRISSRKSLNNDTHISNNNVQYRNFSPFSSVTVEQKSL